MGQQIGDPASVADVGFAPRHVLDLCWVSQDQLEVPVEHVPDRLPIHARCLHGDVSATVLFEPVHEFQQFSGRATKRTRLSPNMALRGDTRRKQLSFSGERRVQRIAGEELSSKPPFHQGAGLEPTKS